MRLAPESLTSAESWSCAARSRTCLRTHSSRLIMRAMLSCSARMVRASVPWACTSASVPTVFGSLSTVTDCVAVTAGAVESPTGVTTKRTLYVPGTTSGPRSERSRSHVTSGRVPSPPVRTNVLPGGGVRSFGVIGAV